MFSFLYIDHERNGLGSVTFSFIVSIFQDS